MNYDRRKDFSKKAWKEMQKANRVTNGFNTGTRTMQTDKKPTRARQKEIIRKAVDNYFIQFFAFLNEYNEWAWLT